MNVSSIAKVLFVGFLILLTAFAHPGAAHAQNCLDYSPYPFWMGEADTPGVASAIERSGDFLFVADGPAGLQVFDVTNADRPILIRTLPLGGDAVDLAIAGDFAYVTAGDEGLHVVDVSNPAACFLVARVLTIEPAVGIFIKDDLALVALAETGLQIFDLTTPGLPVHLQFVASTGDAFAVTADTYFAYLADGTSGIQIIDLTDPAEAAIIESINTPGNAKILVAAARTLYVADGSQGMSVCIWEPDYAEEARWQFNHNGLDTSRRDFNDPDLTPWHHASLDTNAFFVEIPGGNTPNWGLVSPDSSRSTTFNPPIHTIHLGRIACRFQVDTLLTADPGYSDPIDLISSGSPGWNPGDVRMGLDPADGTLVFTQDHPGGGSRDLRSGRDTWEEGVWYEVEVTWGDLGREMRITWADSVDEYLVTSSDQVVAPCFGLDAVDNLIATRGENSLAATLTIDWLSVEDSSPTGRLDETIPVGGYAQDLFLRDDHVFLAVDFGDVSIVDCSVPGNRRVSGILDTTERVQSLVATQLHAYVLDRDAGIQVFRCAFPRAPVPEGILDTPGPAYGVDMVGGLAFIADREFGLQVADLTAFSMPVLLGGVETAGHALDVAVSGNYAHVAEAVFSAAADKAEFSRAVFPLDAFPAPGEKAGRFSAVQIVDITDPAAPSITGTVETPGYALDIAVAGDYTYVADFDGFVVIESSFPADPVVAAVLPTPGRPRDLAVQGDYAFVADLAGLRVIDISIPSDPQIVGSLDTPGPAYGVAVTGTLVLVADAENGLHAIGITDPSSPQLLGTVFIQGGAYEVEAVGNYAYVASGFDTDYSGVHIVDLNSVSLPMVVGGIDTPGSVYSIAFEGDHVFVTDGGMNLQAFLRQCDPGGAPVLPAGFSISRDHQAVTFAWTSPPDAETGIYRLEGSKGESSWEIPIEQDGTGHFTAADPAVDEHAGETVTYTLSQLASQEDWVVLASRQVSFEAPPIPTRLLGAHPNPFNPVTTVSFSVGRAQQVKIGIYDLAGRRVAQLVDRFFETGSYSVVWNGRDHLDGEAASGVYFLRMEADEFSQVDKITLVR